MLEKKLILSKASVVRLIACQALCMYNNEIVQQREINEILFCINEYYIKEFLLDETLEVNNYSNLYKNKFTISLINNIIKNQKSIDEILEKHLKGYNTIENLLDTTRESFRLAIYELQNFPEIDYRVIINEYVDLIAELTNDPKETKFGNAIIEKIALDIKNITKETSESKERKKITLKLNKDISIDETKNNRIKVNNNELLKNEE